jgi:hypothetical protein
MNERKLSRRDFFFSTLAAGLTVVLADPSIAFTQMYAQRSKWANT